MTSGSAKVSGTALVTGFVSRPASNAGVRVGGVFNMRCYNPDGSLKWSAKAHNIVVNAGLNYLLDAGLSGGTPITSWYVGLVDNSGFTAYAAGDTLATHTGWSEFSSYSGNRQAWTDGGVSSQSVDNSGSPASFSITGSGTIRGCFLASAASGSTGTLFAEVDFSGGNRTVGNGDTVEVTYTFSAADDGA